MTEPASLETLCDVADSQLVENNVQAVKSLQTAADGGSARGMSGLGVCYALGFGVTRNTKKAAQLFQKASASGLSSAQFNLGVCYANGWGVAGSGARAAEWYAKAAEQKLAHAKCYLGDCYERGSGVSKDINKAIQLYNEALTLDPSLVCAQFNLAGLLRSPGPMMNKQRAVELLERVAATPQSDDAVEVCFELGDSLRCHVCDVTKAQGASVCLEAARQELKRYNAEMEQEKEQVELDEKEEARLEGELKAQFQFICGKRFESKGQYDKACMMFERAAQAGLAEAQLYLGDCYQRGKGVAKDLVKGAQLYQLAADQRLMTAQYYLGDCYENAAGVERDLPRALELYRLAALQGNLDAKHCLKRLKVSGWEHWEEEQLSSEQEEEEGDVEDDDADEEAEAEEEAAEAEEEVESEEAGKSTKRGLGDSDSPQSHKKRTVLSE